MKRIGSRGFSLTELLVVIALFSLISVVIIQLYNAAYTEFEKASGDMALSRRARSLANKLIPILSTATPVRAGGTECFYHPDAADGVNEVYAVDFFSTACFLSDPGRSGATAIPLLNGNSGNYPTGKMWIDTGFPGTTDFPTGRPIWEIGYGQKSEPVRTAPSIYRYRLAWCSVADTTGGGSTRERSVYLERLQSHPNNGNRDDGSQAIFRSGTPYALSTCPRQVLEKDIARLTFQRPVSNLIQVRTIVVNVETIGGRQVTLDGELMRNNRRSVTQRRYEVVSTVMLPNYTLGRN